VIFNCDRWWSRIVGLAYRLRGKPRNTNMAPPRERRERTGSSR
jgi:hypothetical protein